MDHIGENVRKLRVFLGIKQSAMAEMLNLSVNSYGKIERNQVLLKPKRLKEIAVIFNIAPDYIINIRHILELIKYGSEKT